MIFKGVKTVLFGALKSKKIEETIFSKVESSTIVIVGVPYAAPDTRVKLHMEKDKSYYNADAINTVNKFIHRQITSLDIKKSIYLVDSRYGESNFSKHFSKLVKDNLKGELPETSQHLPRYAE